MKEYAFAANPFKLQRAIAAVGKDEALVKAEYIKLGGLLVEGHEPHVAVTHEVDETTVAETPVYPAKKEKKAKKK